MKNVLKKFGDTPKGVDWTKEEQVDYRYQTMLELINFHHITQKISLLDYGCGLSHLYEYIKKNNLNHIEYTGLEINFSMNLNKSFLQIVIY